jgi:hypothetical protein
MGRFLNADGYVTTGSVAPTANMFAYCGNNPVLNSDPSGKWTFGIGMGYNVTAGWSGGCQG